MVTDVTDISCNAVERRHQSALRQITTRQKGRFQGHSQPIGSRGNSHEAAVKTHAMKWGRTQTVGLEPMVPAHLFCVAADECRLSEIMGFTDRLRERWRAKRCHRFLSHWNDQQIVTGRLAINQIGIELVIDKTGVVGAGRDPHLNIRVRCRKSGRRGDRISAAKVGAQCKRSNLE